MSRGDGNNIKQGKRRTVRTTFELNCAHRLYASVSYLPVDANMFRSVVVLNNLLLLLWCCCCWCVVRGRSSSFAFPPYPLKTRQLLLKPFEIESLLVSRPCTDHLDNLVCIPVVRPPLLDENVARA